MRHSRLSSGEVRRGALGVAAGGTLRLVRVAHVDEVRPGREGDEQAVEDALRAVPVPGGQYAIVRAEAEFRRAGTGFRQYFVHCGLEQGGRVAGDREERAVLVTRQPGLAQ